MVEKESEGPKKHVYKYDKYELLINKQVSKYDKYELLVSKLVSAKIFKLNYNIFK